MNWFKQNPVLTALLALAVLGTGVTGYLAMQAGARQTAAIESFNSQISTLRRLQAKQPFPDAANEAKVKQSVEAYQAAITSFKKELVSMEAPLEDIKPQDFQDNLRNAVDALRSAATQNGVALPEKFFFGFDDFQTQLPTDAQTPRLNREFFIIRQLIEQIVQLPIQRIDSLTRHAAPPAPQDSDPAPPGQPPETSHTFDSFTLAFTASQDKFAAAFDKIPDSGAFVVVRSMTIENTNPIPPPRAEPTPAAAASIFPGDTTTPESAQLPIAFGREAVSATILFEIPDFPGTPEITAAATPPPTN